MDRIVITAQLKPGALERARELTAQGPPFDPAEEGLTRHAVYATETDVAFLFEGPEVERFVTAFINDPVRSTALTGWHDLVDGPPRLAHELYGWNASESGPVSISPTPSA